MKQDDIDRFAGIQRLYGQAALECFLDSHVAVIGLGGVGSWAVESLARSGIGALTLVDMDDVCVSNTNRQLHALAGQYGRTKVDVMAERVTAINPHCRVTAHFAFLTTRNIEQLITPGISGVVDAIDSIQPKAALIAHCRRHRLPVVCAGGAGGKTDPSCLKVADLSRTTQDPLLAKLRNRLRREYGFSRNPSRRFGVEAVYSTQQLVYPAPDGGVSHCRPTGEGPMRLDCAGGFGACTSVTASFGLVAASRILERLARKANRTQQAGTLPGPNT